MTSLIGGAAIALAIPLTATIANTVAHWARTKPQTAGKRKVPGKLSVRGLIDEAFATLFVFFAPLAALAPTLRASTRRTTTLVILTEPMRRFTCWLLIRRLRQSGWPVINASASSRIDAVALDQLAEAVLGKVDPNQPITLVGIGAAGLAARRIAAKHRRFAKVVTVATPHQGSFSRAFPTHLRPQSPRIAEVAEIDQQPRSFDSVALYSDGDAWLEPTTAAYYPGAFNLEVHDVGHLSMFFSKRVYGYIAENLAPPVKTHDR